MKDFETTEVPSIEFIGYRIPQHKQNNCTVLFTRHQSTKLFRKFWYLKYFSCRVHLRNTSRLLLATQTLDAGQPIRISKKPDALLFIDTL